MRFIFKRVELLLLRILLVFHLLHGRLVLRGKKGWQHSLSLHFRRCLFLFSGERLRISFASPVRHQVVFLIVILNRLKTVYLVSYLQRIKQVVELLACNFG